MAATQAFKRHCYIVRGMCSIEHLAGSDTAIYFVTSGLALLIANRSPLNFLELAQTTDNANSADRGTGTTATQNGNNNNGGGHNWGWIGIFGLADPGLRGADNTPPQKQTAM